MNVPSTNERSTPPESASTYMWKKRSNNSYYKSPVNMLDQVKGGYSHRRESAEDRLDRLEQEMIQEALDRSMTL